MGRQFWCNVVRFCA